jgi:hypothetical protein
VSFGLYYYYYYSIGTTARCELWPVLLLLLLLLLLQVVNLLCYYSFYKVITNVVHNYYGRQKLAAMCNVPSTAFSLNVDGVAASFQTVHEVVLGLLFVLSPASYTIAA